MRDRTGPGRTRMHRTVPVVVVVSLFGVVACSGAPAKTDAKPGANTVAKAARRVTTRTSIPSAPRAGTVVDVPFDVPGAVPRALRETTVLIYEPAETLTMHITGISYRGIVCGFSLRGTRPASPVAIRLFGSKQGGAGFDSGAVTVSWTDDGKAEGGAAESNGWSFSAEAHQNRNGTGWVVSIGGVTSAAKDAVPKSAGCELTSPTHAFLPGAGPIGYWAGYATV